MENINLGNNTVLHSGLMSQTTIDYINQQHILVYNALAKEYTHREKIFSDQKEKSISMDYFVNHLEGEKKVLDLGCGAGGETKNLFEKGCNVIGLDISNEMVENARKQNSEIPFMCGNFLDIDYEKESFDGIHAQAFIHLFPKEEIGKIFSKIYSLLKPNGVIKISTTQSEVSKEGWEIKTDYNTQKCMRYRKHFTQDELKGILEFFGFKILKNFTENQKHGEIDKNWMVFIAQKII